MYLKIINILKGVFFIFFVALNYQFSFAQPAFKNEILVEKLLSPQEEYYKQLLSTQVLKQLDKIDWNHIEKKTNADTTLYTIPVVVHVLHDYGGELIPDDTIFNTIAAINSYFLKTNPDTINIIPKFKPIASSTQIAFKLATIDPNGNPTKGIEHIHTYLTNNATDQSKLSQWRQDRYFNIWLVADITAPAAGYTYYPYTATTIPYYDGFLCLYYIFCNSSSGGLDTRGYDALEFGKYLNLPYTCAFTSYHECIDGDLIPDTPPCNDLNSCSNIFDTLCDTPNIQNIMTRYTGVHCQSMFTYGQGQYMQNVLQNDIGKRDSLVTPSNFFATGNNLPMPDLLPIADFSISSNYITNCKFAYINNWVQMHNHSWNDTIINANWTIVNKDTTYYSNSISGTSYRFCRPGYVSVSLAVTGNNTGTTIKTDSFSFYVADTTAINVVNYYQEFAPASPDLNKFVMFNYYDNSFKWELANVGYYDNYCLKYSGYDYRTFPENTTGTPQGDYDDFFTPVFDLSGFADSCFLNFMSSGATVATETNNMNDSLEIYYSIGFNNVWNKLTCLKKSEIANTGTLNIPFEPLWMGDWITHAISLPQVVRTKHTTFRFRYHPGADSNMISSGNNFYLDRFNLSQYPETVNSVLKNKEGVVLFPNPTQGNVSIYINDNNVIGAIIISITDITGENIYEYTDVINANNTKMNIPQMSFTAKGIYFIHITSNNISKTEKLIVE